MCPSLLLLRLDLEYSQIRIIFSNSADQALNFREPVMKKHRSNELQGTTQMLFL